MHRNTYCIYIYKYTVYIYILDERNIPSLSMRGDIKKSYTKSSIMHDKQVIRVKKLVGLPPPALELLGHVS